MESKMCYYTADIYLFKLNYRNTRAIREICSKLTLKIQDSVIDFVLSWFSSFSFALMFPLLTLNKEILAG